MRKIITLKINSTDSFNEKACSFVLFYMATTLLAAFDKETLADLDSNVYYIEGFCGFRQLDSETGSFVIRRKNGQHIMTAALMENGTIAALVRQSEDDIRCDASEYFAEDAEDAELSPFHDAQDFHRFRDWLKTVKPFTVIGTIQHLSRFKM